MNLRKQSLLIQATPKDFRLYLQQELVKRCKKNPRFSVRAFAITLGVENSALSKILCGKRQLTRKMVIRLGQKLGLNPIQISEFSIVPVLENPESQKETFRQLTQDQFAIISDWYHYAIHELCRTNSCKSDVRWIARKLGITLAEAASAVERLLRLGYLERSTSGTLINRSGPLTTLGNEFTTIAFRNLQRQVLEKAIIALEEVPLEKRDQTSMTMAISSTKLKEAKELIKKFRRDLSNFLESDYKNLDSVYHLGISLYPVTKIEN
jgi:plasmid maintenance system antidote protein VapI